MKSRVRAAGTRSSRVMGKSVIAVCGSDNQFSYFGASWNMAGDLIQLRFQIP